MRVAVGLMAAVTLVAACTPAASSPAAGSMTSAGPLPSQAPVPSGTASVPDAASPGAPSPVPSPVPSDHPSAAATASTHGLIAASPVASGPALPPNPFELGGPAPVGSFVLGDSISLSVGPALARLGYPVLGVVGQSASEAYLRTHLTGPTAQAAPAWVIVLGTNNTAGPAEAARLSGWVDLVDSLRSPEARQKVYWVTPHRPLSYVGSKSRWTLDDFNTELRRLDGEHRWLRVIDFDLVAKAHPEWFEQDTAMHLHPDAAGQGVLVALIAGPDAAPVEIPAPLFTGPPPSSAEPAPQTFVNPPRRASASPAPTTPTPVPPAPDAPAPDAQPPDAAGSPAPVPVTSGEASPASSG